MNRGSAVRPAIFTLGLLFAASVLGADTARDDMAPMREMMQRMMADVLPPGLPAEQLPAPTSRGAGLLNRYCTQCHALPGPGMHTAGEWPAVVDRMRGRMEMHGQMMGGLAMPSPAELGDIRAYLQKHAQKALPRSRYGILTEAGGPAFRQTCTQCHALPDPRQHTASEWLPVVARMQRHMAVMRKPVPDPATVERISDFLARHARDAK